MTRNSSPRIFTRKCTRKIIYYLLCSAFLGWMLSTISNRALDVTFLNESAHSVVFIVWKDGVIGSFGDSTLTAHVAPGGRVHHTTAYNSVAITFSVVDGEKTGKSGWYYNGHPTQFKQLIMHGTVTLRYDGKNLLYTKGWGRGPSSGSVPVQ